MEQDIQTKLSAPFADSDIEWRLQYANEENNTGIAVPYVTNRAIQNRLDKTVGIGNWKNEFSPWHGDGKKQGQLCGISIYDSDRKEWITKYDGAEDSEIEPVKGGLSDSMKRAAVQWGVGRYLYSMDTVYVDVEKSGKSMKIKKSEYAKLGRAHQKLVGELFIADPPPANKNDMSPASSVPAPRPNPANTVAQPQPPVSARSAVNQPEPAPVVMHPAAKNKYCVVSAVLKPSMKGVNTHLQLKSPSGEVIMAFAQGDHSALKPDVWIENAVISNREKGGVTFNILDSYDLALPAAA